MALLSIGSDAKTVKGEAKGYLTGMMYLAPSTLSGVNLCPFASAGCIATCLNTAGRGVFNSVQQGRINRSKRFLADRHVFMTELVREIAALVRKAARNGMTPLVRLNGTSDIGWEGLASVNGGMSIIAAFPNVQFYDYTKSPVRMLRYLTGKLPANYHLTFSRSETNEPDALTVLKNGGNVAVVFDTRKGQALPTRWQGFVVIDGDVSDVRPDDPGAFDRTLSTRPTGQHYGYVVGLRAKGKARKDTSGFVVKVPR